MRIKLFACVFGLAIASACFSDPPQVPGAEASPPAGGAPTSGSEDPSETAMSVNDDGEGSTTAPVDDGGSTTASDNGESSSTDAGAMDDSGSTGEIVDVGGGMECSPVVQECPPGEGCYPDVDAFRCFEHIALPGLPGEACLGHTDCGVGSLCDVFGVCVEYCVLGRMCAVGSCVPFLEPIIGLEEVGACSG